MNTYAQYYNVKLNGEIAEALGTSSSQPIDGRLSVSNAIEQAKLVADRHSKVCAWVGFRIMRGDNYRTARPVSDFVAYNNQHPIKRATLLGTATRPDGYFGDKTNVLVWLTDDGKLVGSWRHPETGATLLCSLSSLCYTDAAEAVYYMTDGKSLGDLHKLTNVEVFDDLPAYMSDKAERIFAGKRVVMGDDQWSDFIRIFPDLRTIPNPARVGVLDRWIAYL